MQQVLGSGRGAGAAKEAGLAACIQRAQELIGHSAPVAQRVAKAALIVRQPVQQLGPTGNADAAQISNDAWCVCIRDGHAKAVLGNRLHQLLHTTCAWGQAVHAWGQAVHVAVNRGIKAGVIGARDHRLKACELGLGCNLTCHKDVGFLNELLGS